jgi:hypothetical protein
LTSRKLDRYLEYVVMKTLVKAFLSRHHFCMEKCSETSSMLDASVPALVLQRFMQYCYTKSVLCT